MGADLQREVIFAAFFFECAGAAVPEPIGGTAEWFVVSADARWPDGLQLARFRPTQAEWSGGPWRLPEVPAAALNWPYVVDDDLWIAPLQGAVHRLEGIAAAAAAVTSSSIPADSFPEIANQGASVRSVVRTDSGPLVIEAALDSVRVFARGDDASFEKRLELPHMHEPRGTWDAKFVPELGRVVACMVSGSGVSLIELDGRGELAKDVVTLDSSPAATACDLAWSGSELLVAWSHQSDSDLMSPAIYELRAKIVGLDE